VGGGEDVVGLEGVEVGGSGEVSSEASDGVFDAAFLPGAVRVAEEGVEADLVVFGELGSVIEGNRPALPMSHRPLRPTRSNPEFPRVSNIADATSRGGKRCGGTRHSGALIYAC
jgi:hypothetical protein